MINDDLKEYSLFDYTIETTTSDHTVCYLTYDEIEKYMDSLCSNLKEDEE